MRLAFGVAALWFGGVLAGCYSVSEYRGPGTMTEGSGFSSYILRLPALDPERGEAEFEVEGLPSARFEFGVEVLAGPVAGEGVAGARPFAFELLAEVTREDGTVAWESPVSPRAEFRGVPTRVPSIGERPFLGSSLWFRAERGARYRVRIRWGDRSALPGDGAQVRPVLRAFPPMWGL